MKLKKQLCVLLCIIFAVTAFAGGNVLTAKAAKSSTIDRTVLNFNTNWLYSSADYANGEAVGLNDSSFESVSVPHANTILDSHKGNDFIEQILSFRFVSWYRRHFTLPDDYTGKQIRINFEGVATVADVYLNGKLLANHKGAYTGFTVDITDHVYTDGRDNVLAVRVDSTRQPQIPPEGGSVDYCLFGGIVRDVDMIVTEPVYVERTFVTTPGLTDDKAVVNTQVDITNSMEEAKTYTIETTVQDMDGKTVTTASKKETLPAGSKKTVEIETKSIEAPHLWDVDDPYLYSVKTKILDGTTKIDEYDTTFGMRYFEFKKGPDDGNLYLNGKKMKIVGINRHEQWPWVGRAVPDKLQVQDADLIKASGFNAVRCSHYPQDPSFMDRCDEIGLMVFTEPPGWQHIGDDEWKEEFKVNLEELILRDRNHPSVISWGPRPNESRADLTFNRECEALAKELDPTRPTHGVRVEFDYEGGVNDEVVNDILTVNYRYPETPHHMPYIVTEHSNLWGGQGAPGRSDKDALDFVDSFANVLNYYYGNDKVAGGFGWSMFDYNNEVNYTNTGHVFYSGLYDLFRHEKPVSYLYKSQMDQEDSGPMVYIANNWTPATTDYIYVMSNCDEIELFVNNVSKGKIKPNKFTSLPHPVFEFKNVSYEAGELKAVGYIDGVKTSEFVRATPGEAVRLVATPDYDTLKADGSDMTSVSISAVDANGNVVPFADNKVNVTQKSGAKTTLISEKDVALEGGKIAFLVESVHDETGTAEFEVSSDGLEPATCKIKVDAFKADDLVPASDVSGKVEPVAPKNTVINDAEVGKGLNRFHFQGTGWNYGSEKTAYMQDNHWSDTAGDTCTFRFKGTQIAYYGAKAPGHGIAAFSVDGGEEVLVDCYSAARIGSMVLFDSGKLDPGEHTLKVRVTGDKNSAAIGCFVNADKVELDTYIANDDDKGSGELQFEYVGENWGYTKDTACYAGDNHWSETADEYMVFRFTGTSLKYYATKAPNHGIGAFSIDDGEEQLVDFYQQNRESQMLIYETGDLKYGEHVLKVRVTGEKNASALNDAFVTVDKIVVHDKGETVPAAPDKEALQKAVDQAKAIDQSKYTGKTVQVLKDSLKKAEALLADESLTSEDQQEIDSAADALLDAVKNLEAQKAEDIFLDVSAGDWFRDSVQYVFENGIMTGMTKDTFGPAGNLSRAQFATILYRMEKEPAVDYKDNQFPDVPKGQFYTNAAIWANKERIITGYADGSFGPNDNITREQMATMMYRYAKFKGNDVSVAGNLDGFPDKDAVSEFAETGMAWAVGAQIITGQELQAGVKTLEPQGNASRAHCSTIIQRFMEKY